MSRDISVYFCD